MSNIITVYKAAQVSLHALFAFPVCHCLSFSRPAEDWKAVNEELQKSCRYVIKNLTTDDRLKIRVVAVNAGGRSPPVALPEAVLVKEVAGKKCLQRQKQTCIWHAQHDSPYIRMCIFSTQTDPMYPSLYYYTTHKTNIAHLNVNSWRSYHMRKDKYMICIDDMCLALICSVNGRKLWSSHLFPFWVKILIHWSSVWKLCTC